jgi:uncharacterized lipoprotein
MSMRNYMKRISGIIVGAALLFLIAGCGQGSTSKAPSKEELQSFQKSDLSKMPPEARAKMEASRKQGGPPPAQPK